MPITQDAIVVRNESMPGTELEGAMVFLDVESGDYLRLDGTARAIWDHLERPLAVGELIGLLARRYSIDPDACARDVLPFLDELERSGLVSREPQAK